MRRLLLSSAMVAILTIGIAGCVASPGTSTTPSASPSSTVATTGTTAISGPIRPPADDAEYLPTAAEESQCHQPPISTRIAADTDQSSTTMGEGVLATPDEVRRSGGDAAAATQKAGWDELSPAERLFQECFREEQAGEVAGHGG
jgi:hypothetical protein